LPNQFSFPEKIYFLTITQIPSIPGIYNNLTGQKMYNKKMLLTQHPWLPEAGVEETPGRAGSGNILNVRSLCVKWQFFLHCQKKTVNGWFLKLGCHYFSTWHYLKHNSICTTGQVVKVNNIYTFEEEGVIDIVRMLDVYQASGYLYCTLYFFTRNKIATVSQILNPDDYKIWRIMDNVEYDGIMSRRLWSEVDKEDNLCEFG